MLITFNPAVAGAIKRGERLGREDVQKQILFDLTRQQQELELQWARESLPQRIRQLQLQTGMMEEEYKALPWRLEQERQLGEQRIQQGRLALDQARKQLEILEEQIKKMQSDQELQKKLQARAKDITLLYSKAAEMRQILQEMDRINMVIAGHWSRGEYPPPQYLQQLKELAQRLNEADKIMFTTFQSLGEDLPFEYLQTLAPLILTVPQLQRSFIQSYVDYMAPHIQRIFRDAATPFIPEAMQLSDEEFQERMKKLTPEQQMKVREAVQAALGYQASYPLMWVPFALTISSGEEHPQTMIQAVMNPLVNLYKAMEQARYRQQHLYLDAWNAWNRWYFTAENLRLARSKLLLAWEKLRFDEVYRTLINPINKMREKAMQFRWNELQEQLKIVGKAIKDIINRSLRGTYTAEERAEIANALFNLFGAYGDVFKQIDPDIEFNPDVVHALPNAVTGDLLSGGDFMGQLGVPWPQFGGPGPLPGMFGPPPGMFGGQPGGFELLPGPPGGQPGMPWGQPGEFWTQPGVQPGTPGGTQGIGPLPAPFIYGRSPFLWGTPQGGPAVSWDKLLHVQEAIQRGIQRSTTLQKIGTMDLFKWQKLLGILGYELDFTPAGKQKLLSYPLDQVDRFLANLTEEMTKYIYLVDFYDRVMARAREIVNAKPQLPPNTILTQAIHDVMVEYAINRINSELGMNLSPGDVILTISLNPQETRSQTQTRPQTWEEAISRALPHPPQGGRSTRQQLTRKQPIEVNVPQKPSSSKEKTNAELIRNAYYVMAGEPHLWNALLQGGVFLVPSPAFFAQLDVDKLNVLRDAYKEAYDVANGALSWWERPLYDFSPKIQKKFWDAFWVALNRALRTRGIPYKGNFYFVIAPYHPKNPTKKNYIIKRVMDLTKDGRYIFSSVLSEKDVGNLFAHDVFKVFLGFPIEPGPQGE